jgi:hypothetical protein
MKKKILCLLVFALMLFSASSMAYANTPIKLIFNGQELETDVPPLLADGRVLVPVRVISEALGVDIEWDSKQNAVLINAEKNKSEDLRISNLERALAPEEPLEAVNSWAKGVKTRNGALQYAVMSPELREEYYDELSEGWSTGVSSPWVDSYEITERGVEDGNYKFEVTFTYTDSTKNTFTETQFVTVQKFEDHWFVANINKVDVSGEITEIFSDDGELTGIFVENPQAEKGPYDKAKISIIPETKIFKGYTNQELSPDDLEKGMKVEVSFHGPVLMIYPVQGGAEVIRVF